MKRDPVETYVSVGIKKATKVRLDNLCHHLNLARGPLLDLFVQSIAPIRKTPSQAKVAILKLHLINRGKRLLKSLHREEKI